MDALGEGVAEGWWPPYMSGLSGRGTRDLGFWSTVTTFPYPRETTVPNLTERRPPYLKECPWPAVDS
jgi:hypothetical protein